MVNTFGIYCILVRCILHFPILLDMNTIKLFTYEFEFQLIFVCKKVQDHYKNMKQLKSIGYLIDIKMSYTSAY